MQRLFRLAQSSTSHIDPLSLTRAPSAPLRGNNLLILYKTGISCVIFPKTLTGRQALRTRIRYFRKARGLTQTELAESLGTTAATVSRLETADMTLSTGWLERIAQALDVGVTDLISAGRENLACQVELRVGGLVAPLPEAIPLAPALAEGTRDPVALRVAREIGPYSAGDMLIADTVPVRDASALLGRDCLITNTENRRLFGRLASLEGGTCLVVPPEAGAAALKLSEVEKVAPVVALIRHFPPVSRPRSGR